MATSSPSTLTTHLTSSGSDEDLLRIGDLRKRKRMISNRESARRSRMRKQKHLDDLVAQLSRLRKENSYILTNVTVTTQMYLGVEAENSVLRAQTTELTHRLSSLTQIIECMNFNNGMFSEGGTDGESDDHWSVAQMNGEDSSKPWSSMYLNLPIMASPDMFMH